MKTSGMACLLALLACLASTRSVWTQHHGQMESTCFAEVYYYTQSCSNMNKQYVTTLGGGSGLGSEWSAYFMRSLWRSMMSNRRMVYWKSQRKWEYDCPEQAGFACYLDFPPCNDSVAGNESLVLTSTVVDSEALDNPGSSILHNGHKPGSKTDVHRGIPKVFDHMKALGKNNETACDITKVPFSAVAGMTTRILYNLNRETKKAILEINDPYKNILSSSRKYIALQIRLEDKKYEMSAAAWKWLTEGDNIAKFTKEHMYDLKDLFIATDNCTAVQSLSRVLDQSITFHGSCIKGYSGREILKQDQVKVRTKDRSSALHALADVEMLRRGKHFIGLFESNYVRFVHLLRYPHSHTSHALATEVHTEEARRTINSHMHDINYFNA